MAFQDKTSSELLPGLKMDPNIIQLDATHDFTDYDKNNQSNSPPGPTMNTDIVHMPSNRTGIK